MKEPKPSPCSPLRRNIFTSPRSLRSVGSLCFALPLCFFVSHASATNFVVDTNDDEAYDGGTLSDEMMDGTGLSLREAVALANQNGGSPDSGDLDGDTITFGGLGYLISAPNLTLTSEITITDDLSIDGFTLGGNASINGASATRLFVTNTTPLAGADNLVLLTNLNLLNGTVSGNGGAILTSPCDELALDSVRLRNCVADNGGAIYSDGSRVSIIDSSFDGNAATAAAGSGGAFFNAAGGTLAVNDTGFENNVANRAGGAIEDQSAGTSGFDITLTNATFIGNKAGVAPATAAPGNGGAIHITGSGSIDISGGSASDNMAAREGGAYWNDKGLMTISDTTISSNSASGPDAHDGGGGLFNNGGTLTVTSTTLSNNLADGSAGSGGAILTTDGAVTLSGVIISSNTANRAGGGIEAIDGELSLDGVTLGGASAADGNIAGPSGSAAPGNGGGIHISGSTKTTITGGTVQFNQAALEGGGLWNQANSVMTLTAGTLVANNTASGDAADDGGGGIFNNGGEVEINAVGGVVEISRNIASGTSGSGGGLHNQVGGVVTINGATFTGNLANRAGGAIEDASGAGLGITLVGVTLDSNNAGVAPAVGAPGSGGGVHISGPGDIDITGGTISNNIASSEGGGLWNGTGRMNLVGPSITANTASGAGADQGGGGVFNAGGVVDITLSTLIDLNVADGTSGSGGGILNDAGGTVTITNSTITNNRANRAGGGIEDNSGDGLGLTVTNTTLSNNNAGAAPATANPGNGGGLHISGSGSALFTGGVIDGNVAAREGGGLWNSVGTLTVDGSTLSNNIGQGPALDDGGGAIFNNGGTLIVQNGAMLTGNSATGAAGSGGGILNLTNGTVSVTDSTLTGNVANRAGGGIEDQSDLTSGVAILLTNTTLSENNAGVAPATAAPGNGGGLHVTGPGNVTVEGGTVNANVAAAEGGGLWIGSGILSVNGVMVTANIASGDASDQGGGGLFSAGGIIEVTDSTLDGNVADGAAGSGGGILNDAGGSLTVTGSILSNNVANRAGGGIEDNSGMGLGVVLNNVTFEANNAGVAPAVAAPGSGGAMHITGPGDATVEGGTLILNTAASEGGGLWNGTGTMTVSNVSLLENIASGAGADQGGGALFNAGGTLTVEGDTIIADNVANGASGSGGGILNDGGILKVTGAVLMSNVANRAGGALEVTANSESTLADCIVNENVAGPSGTAAPGNGGAIHISGSGKVTTSGSTYDSNSAGNEGGGLWNSGAGTLEVTTSTLSANMAPDGGGLFNQAGAGVTTVTNSTVSGNSATNGGGAQIEGGSMSFLHVTLANNSATTDGGGVNVTTGDLVAANSLFGDNTAGGNGPDVNGAFAMANSNLVEDSSGTSGLDASNLTGVDPLLAPLSDNGGATLTHLPDCRSPAVDAGDSAASSGLTTDQRGMGFARLLGNAVDIGATEFFLQTFAEWADNNFTAATPLSQRGLMSDPDGDGLSNGIEWLTGLSPEASDGSPFGFTSDGSALSLSYPRSKSVPPSADVLEVSEDLVSWDDSVMPTRNSTPGGAGSENITLTLDSSAFAKLFARIKVSN
ncbi:choice-of-anchor Q domain-containing protein [Roseibacillus persicicus]|uniref:beta strand repeat-containing protein n=1 Tax=Roseibacillus persicicus TaxID=454148 RepID=UPI00398A83D8